MLKNEFADYKTFKDPYQTEKDYLQDIVLYLLYSGASDEFVFKGGTALSKFYHSDRFSEDLDFTVTRYSQNLFTRVKETIDRVVKSIPYESRYKEEPEINKFGTITSTIIIEGPRYTGKQGTLQQVRFEINTKGPVVYKPLAFPRNPVYADATNYVALVMDAREIFSEKIRAIMSAGRRHRERDLYDIYYLAGKKTMAGKEVILAKLKESEMEFSADSLSKNIESVKSTWAYLEPFVQHKLESYDYVKEFVNENLENIGVL